MREYQSREKSWKRVLRNVKKAYKFGQGSKDDDFTRGRRKP